MTHQWRLIKHVYIDSFPVRYLQLRINMLAVTNQYVSGEFYKFLEIQRQGQDIQGC